MEILVIFMGNNLINEKTWKMDFFFAKIILKNFQMKLKSIKNNYCLLLSWTKNN